MNKNKHKLIVETDDEPLFIWLMSCLPDMGDCEVKELKE